MSAGIYIGVACIKICDYSLNAQRQLQFTTTGINLTLVQWKWVKELIPYMDEALEKFQMVNGDNCLWTDGHQVTAYEIPVASTTSIKATLQRQLFPISTTGEEEEGDDEVQILPCEDEVHILPCGTHDMDNFS